MRTLIIDVASAPIVGAEAFIDKAAIEAPSNYVKPEAIAGFIEKEYKKRIGAAGLDIDLARITAIGFADDLDDGVAHVTLCRTEDDEKLALLNLAAWFSHDYPTGPTGPSGRTSDYRLITYNGHSFDLPLLMRRARYLGVKFPKLNIDRYRSPHVDLLQDLSDRDPNRRRPLGFYVRRLGWTDLVKPLTGEQESQVPVTGQWAELEQSVIHDVTAIYRLAVWTGVIQANSDVEPIL